MRTGWESATLGDVVKVMRNGINCKQDKSGRGDKITRIETISDGTVNLNRVGYANLTEQEKQKSRLSTGDILFSHINSAVHVGKTAIIDDECNLYHGINLMLMRPDKSIVPQYLQYFLNSLFQSGYWRTVAKQSVNQASVNQTDIRSVPISYPALPEQQRIVAILDEAFAGLATATANAEKNLKNVSQLFESFLSSIFGQNWETQTLGDISENLDSKRIPVTKSDRKSGDIPYYGASGPVDCVDNFIFDEDLLLVSEDGANLVMRNYPIAFSIAGKSWVNNHAHVLRFPDLASQKFVEYYLNSISLMPYVNGMAQPKLNQKALNSIPVPWPKLEERENVVARLEDLAAQTDRLRELYEMRISALAELKQSTLGKAFSGELTSPPSQATTEAAE